MFGPLSSFRMTSPLTSPVPRMFPARAILAATADPPGPELLRAREIAHANGVRLHSIRLGAVATEHPAELAISDVAEDVRATLVVVGPDRQRSSRRQLAERLHDAAECPVLQVRNAAKGPYHRVVIATDLRSAVSDMKEAAEFVAPLARGVEYVHVFQSPSEAILVAQGMGLVAVRHYRRESEREARARMTVALRRAKLDPSAVRFEHGRPAFVLSSMSEKTLLVIHRGRSWLKHAVFGSVTRAVLEESRSDVLVV